MIKKRLLPHQARFVQAPFVFEDLRFFFLIAGYGAGKTSSLVDLTLRAIAHYSGKRDREGMQPKIGVCGITLTFLKKTFSGKLVTALRQSKTTHNYDKANNIIYVAGVELHLVAIEDSSNLYGYDWACALVDELDELPTHAAIDVVKSINDRCRQIVEDARPPFLAFATTSQGLKGTYQVVQNFRKQGIGYMIMRARTRDNIFLPKEYVETQYKIYNEKERECLLEGKFISINSGLVYPDYNPAKDKITDYDVYTTIQQDDTVYIGQDFNIGFNKAVAGIVRDGVIYIVKEYAFPDIRRAPEVYRYDFPENEIRWIPDATYNHHLPEFKKELRKYGIRVVYRAKNPLVKDRSFLINKLFCADRMKLSSCPELDNSLIIRQNDEKTGLPSKGKGESAPDHLCDCLEYLSYYVVSWRKDFKDLYKVIIERKIQKNNEYGYVDAANETYVDNEDEIEEELEHLTEED